MKRLLKSGALMLGLALHLAVVASAGAELQFTSMGIAPIARFPSNGVYSVTYVTNDGHRLYYGAHHFATVMNSLGEFAIRYHPGVDQNGWGTTTYLRPFIDGAVLTGTVITSISPGATGIVINAHGSVSMGTNAAVGTWSMTNLFFTYDPTNKAVAGSSTYAIQLAVPPSSIGKALNLYKMASNYLKGVPLLDGTTGDTGDMTAVVYNSINGTTEWQPPAPPAAPGDFPGPDTNRVSIAMSGAFNQVDTLRQGYRAIAASYKPAVAITLTSMKAGGEARPGLFYTQSEMTNFWSDNVGVTPVVLSTSTTTSFLYSVAVRAEADPGDGVGLEVDLAATWTGNPGGSRTCEVYFAESAEASALQRYVGTLTSADATNFTGRVQIPAALQSSGRTGLILGVGPYRSP